MKKQNLFGLYRRDMSSGYYPPMSYDEWLLNINGVAEDTNMEIDVVICIFSDNDEEEPSEYKRTYKVCATSDDLPSVYAYAKEAVQEEFPSYDDLEIESWRWIE